jgi:hypothetical protein
MYIFTKKKKIVALPLDILLFFPSHLEKYILLHEQITSIFSLTLN